MALLREGVSVGRRRIRRLMRKLGLWAVRPKRNTSKRHPEHKVYPYLLRGKTIDQPISEPLRINAVEWNEYVDDDFGIECMKLCSDLVVQFDLFLPNIVDLKSKRMKPIEYQNDNDGIFVTVLPHQDYGMATIWDADVLIWAASVLSDIKNRRLNEIPRELKFQPHDLLKVIGRSTGGKDYAQLRGALDRLKSTIINTNIRAARGTKHITFSWIDQWEDLVDSRTKESRGLTLTLSDWFYRGVTEEGGVL